jgi:hypothetical protein
MPSAKGHALGIVAFSREPFFPTAFVVLWSSDMGLNCAGYPLTPPKVVAISIAKNVTPTNPFPDAANLFGVPPPKYGQDITFGVGRRAPVSQWVGGSENELKEKMEKLLAIFAAGDKSGMARRLFTDFLSKKGAVRYFDDPALTAAAARHENIKHFCDAALSAPDSPQRAVGKTYIHQALKNANWDISKIVLPTDLGAPAFNIGSKIFATGDFDNGLGVMINGVQYVYVVAKNYYYDQSNGIYCIVLKYIFYDIFGLDDDDLHAFGANADGALSSNASVGITAWWQLQHQYGYAPLVTRIILEKTFEVEAK